MFVGLINLQRSGKTDDRPQEFINLSLPDCTNFMLGILSDIFITGEKMLYKKIISIILEVGKLLLESYLYLTKQTGKKNYHSDT